MNYCTQAISNRVKLIYVIEIQGGMFCIGYSIFKVNSYFTERSKLIALLKGSIRGGGGGGGGRHRWIHFEASKYLPRKTC